jgi:hypothetical protein
MRHVLLVVLFLLVPFLKSGLAAPTLLFDQGHGQTFTIEKAGELQLGQLATQLRADGWQVASTASALTPEALAGLDALVISGPFKPFTAKELAAIDTFLQDGGRLAVMLHVAQPAASLLNQLGVVHANGVVREGDQRLVINDDPFSFRVSHLQPHPLTNGLTSFALYGAWPLLPEGANSRSIADTSLGAWVDLDGNNVFSQGDAMQELSVLVVGQVGKGEWAVFGDDAMFQNKFLQGENIKLAANLSRWLRSAVD